MNSLILSLFLSFVFAEGAKDCSILVSRQAVEWQKTYLSSEDVLAIGQAVKEAPKLDYRFWNGLPEWVHKAYRIYKNARLKELDFSAAEKEDAGRDIVGATNDRKLFRADNQYIFMSDKFIESPLVLFILAHELEHRIQIQQLRRHGLPDKYVHLFMKGGSYFYERSAMRAEWELANALPLEGRKWLEKMIEESLKDSISISSMIGVTQLSLKDYIQANHSAGRYSLPAVREELIYQSRSFKNDFRSFPKDQVDSLIGEWQIPKEAFLTNLAHYANVVNNSLPKEYVASLRESSPGFVSFSVKKLTPGI